MRVMQLQHRRASPAAAIKQGREGRRSLAPGESTGPAATAHPWLGPPAQPLNQAAFGLADLRARAWE
ncbi:hypothetical protein BDY21DRAFT_351081 [Lineolata rhizophorae]|uniref:Uncharacterized protein n=1 Tax=Lineolata rhizophorae TaxID=578093 RepID=A0A6A6NTH2_9PEZI|nr:hypothetical protein BDY21DRAFT_351081 [Lineolata rhizophorae]